MNKFPVTIEEAAQHFVNSLSSAMGYNSEMQSAYLMANERSPIAEELLALIRLIISDEVRKMYQRQP